MRRPFLTAALALTCALSARAEALAEFSSQGLRGSHGLVVRLLHPASWKNVASDDELALAELQGPHGRLTGILQVARGRRQADIETLCRPERARTMLQNLGPEESARVTDVVARGIGGRPGYEIRYERSNGRDFLLARSVVVCLKDTRLLVSCGATGETKAAVAAIEPVCKEVLGSLSVAEE